MLNQVILWACLVVPWFSFFLIPGKTVKRYMPVAIFASLLVTLYCELAAAFSWWVIHQTIFPAFTVFVPFTFGVFLVGTVWIFYLTFQRFWWYMLLNLVVDAAFAFPGNALCQWLGLYTLVNYTSWEVLLTFLVISVVLYGYQTWQEGVFTRSGTSSGEGEAMNLRLRLKRPT